MTNNFSFENQQAVVIANFDFGGDSLEPSYNPALVIKAVPSSFGIGNPAGLIASFIKNQRLIDIDSVYGSVWEKGYELNVTTTLPFDDSLKSLDNVINTPVRNDSLKMIDVSMLLKPDVIESKDVGFKTSRAEQFKRSDVVKCCEWVVPTIKDVSFKIEYQSVNLYGDTGRRPDYRYFTSVNFNFKGEPANVTSNFVDPVRFDSIKNRLAPVGTVKEIDAGKKQRVLDFSQRLYWGYSVNNFIIGGSVLLPNEDNDTRPPEEVKIHPDYEVFRIVNIVNIVTLPSREIVDFADFTLGIDVDSFCWTANFNILGQKAYDLIKPNGRNLTQLEVNINGMIFSLFVATVNRSKSHGKTQYTAVAYSPLKLLSFPYAPKRSFTQTSSRTASQLVSDELTGTGLILDWKSPDWTVAANIHSYQDKTAMGAILDVVNAIGAVIQPSLDGTTVKIAPRFPVSPWNWSTAVLNHTVSTGQFISIGDSNVPKDNPNRVYVYGENNSGVGGRVTRQGTNGANLLPDVVNKYITTGNAAQERGRIELAKNSYLNEVSMVTYVDTNVGVFLPLELVEFTEINGDKWRGQVVATSIACKRNGTALLQNIKVLRYYE